MKKRITVAALPEFDEACYLADVDAVAADWTEILETDDSGLLAAALGEIARGRDMSELAKSAGRTRETLYKAQRPGSARRRNTVKNVGAALGLRLVVQA